MDGPERGDQTHIERVFEQITADDSEEGKKISSAEARRLLEAMDVDRQNITNEVRKKVGALQAAIDVQSWSQAVEPRAGERILDALVRIADSSDSSGGTQARARVYDGDGDKISEASENAEQAAKNQIAQYFIDWKIIKKKQEEIFKHIIKIDINKIPESTLDVGDAIDLIVDDTHVRHNIQAILSLATDNARDGSARRENIRAIYGIVTAPNPSQESISALQQNLHRNARRMTTEQAAAPFVPSGRLDRDTYSNMLYYLARDIENEQTWTMPGTGTGVGRPPAGVTPGEIPDYSKMGSSDIDARVVVASNESTFAYLSGLYEM